MATSTTRSVILVKNGRVYDHAGNVHLPPIADLLIVDGIIAAARAGIAAAVGRGETLAELGTRAIDQTIDATDKLLMPGFVNAHYHSHDVLLKGCFELSQTQHGRNPSTHLGRCARMPAQRDDDRAGSRHHLPVRRGAS